MKRQGEPDLKKKKAKKVQSSTTPQDSKRLRQHLIVETGPPRPSRWGFERKLPGQRMNPTSQPFTKESERQRQPSVPLPSTVGHPLAQPSGGLKRRQKVPRPAILPLHLQRRASARRASRSNPHARTPASLPQPGPVIRCRTLRCPVGRSFAKAARDGLQSKNRKKRERRRPAPVAKDPAKRARRPRTQSRLRAEPALTWNPRPPVSAAATRASVPSLLPASPPSQLRPLPALHSVAAGCGLPRARGERERASRSSGRAGAPGARAGAGARDLAHCHRHGHFASGLRPPPRCPLRPRPSAASSRSPSPEASHWAGTIYVTAPPALLPPGSPLLPGLGRSTTERAPLAAPGAASPARRTSPAILAGRGPGEPLEGSPAFHTPRTHALALSRTPVSKGSHWALVGVRLSRLSQGPTEPLAARLGLPSGIRWRSHPRAVRRSIGET